MQNYKSTVFQSNPTLQVQFLIETLTEEVSPVVPEKKVFGKTRRNFFDSFFLNFLDDPQTETQSRKWVGKQIFFYICGIFEWDLD